SRRGRLLAAGRLGAFLLRAGPGRLGRSWPVPVLGLPGTERAGTGRAGLRGSDTRPISVRDRAGRRSRGERTMKAGDRKGRELKWAGKPSTDIDTIINRDVLAGGSKRSTSGPGRAAPSWPRLTLSIDWRKRPSGRKNGT